ncbi:MAG: hypothetical protein EKK37_01965 [Sphingobacteriales bacterium]|nr:MAG: hypothetical protein EKK37_01965 [Sphingobacteriales bacterium]
MKFILAILILLLNSLCGAQPYINIAGFKFQNSPDAGGWRRDNNNNKFNFWGASFNIPIQFKKDSSAIIFSAATEYWNIDIDKRSASVKQQSFILPVAYIKPLNEKWNLIINGMVRWNGIQGDLFKKSLQAGGAVIINYKKKINRQIKFGIYYNSEFSGPFIIPLAGIDWTISKKDNLFGILPGNMIYEHKLNNHFYWGASFKAITSSFITEPLTANNPANFIRVDDNQLALYLDSYISKSIVLTVSAGHSVLRKFRFGVRYSSQKYFFKEPVNDELLFELGLSYRLRLR